MRHSLPFLRLLALALVVLPTTPVPAQPPYTYAFGGPVTKLNQPYDRKTEDDLTLKGLSAAFEAFTPLEQDTPQNRLRRIGEVLEAHEEADYRFAMEQMIGLQLLNDYLAERRIERIDPAVLAMKRPGADTLEAVAFAVRLMTRNHNPNAHLLAATLHVLDDYWRQEEIREQALLAARAVTAYLDRLAARDCADCGVDPGGEQRLSLIRAGITQLEALAAQK